METRLRMQKTHTLHSKTLNITFIVFGEVCIWKILKIVTRLSLPLYKKNISLGWEIIIIVLVFQFKLQEYLPIALVAFTTIPSTVVKSDILSTKDGFVILKLKAKKAKLLNSTMNKFEPNWSITQVPSARKQVRHFWFNFWLPGVVTWHYFSNLPKKQIQINSGIPPARLSSHWMLYFSTWQRRYIFISRSIDCFKVGCLFYITRCRS